MYVVDTNTLIYFFKGIGRVAHHLLSSSPKDIYIPSIVLYELEVGIQKSKDAKKRKHQLEQLLDTCQFLPFGKKESYYASIIRTLLEEKGQPIGPLDILIAGTAMANNFILITHNTKEFKKVKDLKLDDWF